MTDLPQELGQHWRGEADRALHHRHHHDQHHHDQHHHRHHHEHRHRHHHGHHQQRHHGHHQERHNGHHPHAQGAAQGPEHALPSRGSLRTSFLAPPPTLPWRQGELSRKFPVL